MDTPPVKLLLASSSTYRRALLSKLCIPFDHASPNINETPLPEESVEQLVSRLAEQKCLACTPDHPNHYVIGSDQAIEFEGEILGKPGDHETAFHQLKRFSGNTVRFHTSICLLTPKSLVIHADLDTTTVHFRNLSNTEIETYLRKETPYDCAGSFKSEGLGITLFRKIEGSDPNSLIGLPLIALTNLLIQAGLNPLSLIKP